MDISKLDPQWVLAQGIAVFVCVILCGLLMSVVAWLLRIIVKELRELRQEQASMTAAHTEAVGKLIGAIRWLGENIRNATGQPPPDDPDDGFKTRKNVAPRPSPGKRAASAPTPTPQPFPIDELPHP